MKKLLALALALVMALSVGVIAFAEGDDDGSDSLDYVCSECGGKFKTADELNNHMIKVHKVADKECPYCHNKFADEAEFNRHFEVCPKKPTVSSPGPFLNECPYCGRWFDNETEYNNHINLCKQGVNPEKDSRPDARLICPKCGKLFVDEAQYNEHIKICTEGDKPDYVDLTVKEILNLIVDVAKSGMSQWDAIESVVIRIVDFIENIGKAAVDKADVKCAVDDLETALKDNNLLDKIPCLDALKDLKLFDKCKLPDKLPSCGELMDALKQKIKDLYAGEAATVVEPSETEKEEPAETGSSSVGIAVFAAISVAAAAAYVCSKKKDS